MLTISNNKIMKTTVLSVILLAAYAFAFAQESVPAMNYTLPKNDVHYRYVNGWIEDTIDSDYHHPSQATIEAFRDIKFGVRIHWGLYSITGQGNESWPFLMLSNEKKQAYQELYKTWNPTGFNAEEWMKLFSENGIKMFAITSMHHEGFSMFDTKARVKKRVNWIAPDGPVLEDCDLAYSIMETPFHRDVIKELCDAAHKYGLKIDLYYSHPDWYNADFRPYNFHPLKIPDLKEHPELYGNAVRDSTPYVIVPDPTPAEEARMLAYHREQLTQLLTNYGKIDMICLDQWLGKKVWPQMRQEMKDFRKIQPEVMFRARGIGNYGDYYTPEGFIPGSQENTDMPWFVIYPYGKSFSYIKNDNFKGVAWIINSLTDAVAKGGNFMMGIGPDATGRFDPLVIQAIKETGAWLKVNGEAIYSTRPREGGLWKEGDTIRYTRTKDKQTIYAISRGWPGRKLALKTVEPKQGSKVYMLGFAKPLEWKYSKETGLEIFLPAELRDESKRPCKMAWTFKIAALN
jgi:alpha-L-fucosidase